MDSNNLSQEDSVDIKTDSGIWGTMFGIPCVVADNFLKLASGDQLKVLIYVLRHSGKLCTDDEIARNTGVPLQETREAVQFWQQVNVLPENDNKTADHVTNTNIMQAPDASSENEQIDVSMSVSEKDIPQRQRQNLSPSEIADMLKNSNEISELFKVAESALGSLNHMQQNSLIYIFDYLGLKTEIIITLLFYCKNIEKTNPAYIEQIARSWAENDINTLSAAEEEIQRMTLSHELTGKIMKMFEMNRRPTSKQAEYIENWRKEGFSAEMIKLAYEKTVESINKLSFAYINSILMSWKNSGYKTTDDVKNAEKEYRKNSKVGKKSKNQHDDSDIEKYNVVINKF